jgi:hypothetical protein
MGLKHNSPYRMLPRSLAERRRYASNIHEGLGHVEWRFGAQLRVGVRLFAVSRIVKSISSFVVVGFLLISIPVSSYPAQSRGSAGPAKFVPKTVDEAVLALKTEWLSPADRDWILRTPRDHTVATLHFPFGTAVRNSFKLWGDNPELMASCGVTDPEECSSIIFDRLWQAVRADADPGLVRRLDCQFTLIERIQINYKGFGKLTVGRMLNSIHAQIDQQMSSMARTETQPCQTALRLEPTGHPHLSCFVRAEFSKDKLPRASLDRFLG